MRSQGEQTLAIDGVEQVAPASTTTVVSDSFKMADVVKIGLDLIAVSSGDVDVVVKLLTSQDNTNFSIEDGYANLINITDEVRHRLTVQDAAIPAAKYGKLQFIGQGTNHASVVITGILNLIRDDR